MRFTSNNSRRNSVNDYVEFLTDNPGYYTENELHSYIFHYSRGGCESNKKYADLLRRAWGKGLINRRLVAGKINRLEYFIPTSESADYITDTVPEEKNFPELLENRNNGQTFTLTNSNNINTQNTQNMQNTTITTATVQSCISSIFSKDDVLNLLEQQKAEILASIPEPKPTTELSREVIRKVADALLAAFESEVKNGLANFDFDDIANDAEVEISYDRTIVMTIDDRSARSAIEEVIGYEMTDAEGLADLIEQQIDIAKHSLSE